MSRERIILGTAGALCAGLLVAALLIPKRPPSAGGTAVAPEGAAAPADTTGPAEGAAPGEGAAVQQAEAPPPARESPPAAGSPAPGAPPAAEASPSPAPSASPSYLSEQNRREVVLFFEESEGENLGPERRKIFETSSPIDQAKQIVVELINGPHNADLLPTLPPETRLLGLYLDRAGTAFVDLSDDLVTLHPGGTEEEIATIFSLVDSLTYNLHEIKRVHILIGGEERDTLKEHLDLRRDYRQDLSIVDMDRKG